MQLYADSEYDIVSYIWYCQLDICCCLGPQSKQTSELCQKRGFNGSTGVIG